MEDWLHFVEAIAPYVFSDSVLPPKLEALWNLLSKALMHYFRPFIGSRAAFMAAAEEGWQSLSAYACQLEKDGLRASLFTLNLHVCVCR